MIEFPIKAVAKSAAWNYPSYILEITPADKLSKRQDRQNAPFSP